MTDLEITKLCAEALGLKPSENLQVPLPCWTGEKLRGVKITLMYDPLHDDAQAMALVKKFLLSVGFDGGWACVKNDGRGMLQSGAYHYPDLNRAICECVAKMQASK